MPLLAYHWHPEDLGYHGKSGEPNAVNWPHVHIYDPSLALDFLLVKAHLPTGRIALEDVILLLIREFGIRARRGDWQPVL